MEQLYDVTMAETQDGNVADNIIRASQSPLTFAEAHALARSWQRDLPEPYQLYMVWVSKHDSSEPPIVLDEFR